MQSLAQTLRNLGTVRLAAIGFVAMGLLAFFLFFAARLNAPNMALLYGDLESSDSAKIVSKLDGMNIPYAIKGEGRQILVPSDRVLRLRMAMAEDGLPVGGSVGYELFDRSESLGTTNFVQNVNLVRALEGELARTIRALGPVQEARVHLVLPKRELFSRRQQDPSASVVVKTKGAERIPKSQVLAIQHLVSSAVPGLKPTRVSIIDSRGRLLARAGGEGPDAEASAANSDDLRRANEERLVRMIEELVEQSVGVGRARAQVSVEMDFDRITTSSETYDPDGQVVRSVQNVSENANASEASTDSNVSVANNLPDARANQGAGARNNSRSARTEETTNYEISKTVKSHVRESGTIRRLSVAVLVDGTYAAEAGGPRSYQPRSTEELEKIATLVRSAVGFDQKRGDTLEVVNLRFQGVDVPVESEAPLFGLTKSDYFRIAEIFVLAVVGILVILLVVRPLVVRTLDALPSALDSALEKNLLADQSVDQPALAGPGGTGVANPDDDSMVTMREVEGRVRASTLKKIAEVVERHPEETVAVMRQWMYKDA